MVELNITQGTIQPMPIAITDFTSDGTIDADAAREISDVVANDLKSSGLFLPIDHAAFIEKGLDVAARRASRIGARSTRKPLLSGALVTATASSRPSSGCGTCSPASSSPASSSSPAPKDARRVGHIIADVIYERITGEKGYFDTRIVFVDELGPKNKRIKRLAIMDQDGHNVRLLTTGQDLVLTPRFSPSTQEITYMSFEGDNPKVYLLNIETGQKEIVGTFPGMTFAPRFSPDGQEIVMSLEQSGATNIYAMDLRSRRTIQLTNSQAINTSPCYSPDGRQIVFESDRDGTQQIYVMNADGSNQHRISSGSGSYSTPVWSPRGDLIAFTKLSGGHFLIGVMKPDGIGRAHPDRGLPQ